MDEEDNNQRHKILGFKPQKENIYNQLLPYADQLDQESARLFNDIKTNLVKAVLARVMRPGCMIWTSRLNKGNVLALEKLSSTDIQCYWSTKKPIVEKVYEGCAIMESSCLKPHVIKKSRPLSDGENLECYTVLTSICQNSALCKHSRKRKNPVTSLRVEVSNIKDIEVIFENINKSTFLPALQLQIENYSMKDCCKNSYKTFIVRDNYIQLTNICIQGSEEWKLQRKFRLTGINASKYYNGTSISRNSKEREKKSSNQVAHLASFVTAVVSGLMTAYGIGYATDSFGGYCILYSNIKFADSKAKSSVIDFINRTSLPDRLKEIDAQATTWGVSSYCLFCQFTPLLAAIVAIILAVFFCLCAKGGAGNITDTFYHPWRLVYPTMFVSLIALSTLAASTAYLGNGVDVFYQNFFHIFLTSRCTTEINMYTLIFHEVQKNLISALNTAWYCSILALAAWSLQFFVLLLRVTCIADFMMLKIDVLMLDKQEQEQVVVMPDEESLAPIADIEDMEAKLEEDAETGGSPKKKRKLTRMLSDLIRHHSRRKSSFLERSRKERSSQLLTTLKESKGEQLPRRTTQEETEPDTEMDTLSISSQQPSTSADATDKIDTTETTLEDDTAVRDNSTDTDHPYWKTVKKFMELN